MEGRKNVRFGPSVKSSRFWVAAVPGGKVRLGRRKHIQNVVCDGGKEDTLFHCGIIEPSQKVNAVRMFVVRRASVVF